MCASSAVRCDYKWRPVTTRWELPLVSCRKTTRSAWRHGETRWRAARRSALRRCLPYPMVSCEIPERTVKALDLVDVVAGGDGFFGRRNRGIDPANGRMVDAQPRLQDCGRVSDGRYHRVEKLPFVDGVFIADTRVGQVQIDSAGHAFDGFPDSNPPFWRDDLQRQTVGASLSDCTPLVGLRYDGAAVGKVADASTDPLPGVTNHTKFATVRPDPYSYVVLIGRNPASTKGQLIKTKLDVYVPSTCPTYVLLSRRPRVTRPRFKSTCWGTRGMFGPVGRAGLAIARARFERNAWVPVEVVADYAAQTYTATVGGVHWSGRFIEAATDQARIYLCWQFASADGTSILRPCNRGKRSAGWFPGVGGRWESCSRRRPRQTGVCPPRGRRLWIAWPWRALAPGQQGHHLRFGGDPAGQSRLQARAVPRCCGLCGNDRQPRKTVCWPTSGCL